MTTAWRLSQRTDAQHVPCPYCLVAIGETCVNRITGQPYRHFPAHLERLKVAHNKESEQDERAEHAG